MGAIHDYDCHPVADSTEPPARLASGTKGSPPSGVGPFFVSRSASPLTLPCMLRVCSERTTR